MADLTSNPMPFEVIEDEDAPQRIGLELEVYQFDNPLQIIDVIPSALDPSFIDEMKSPGGGSVNLHIDDPKLKESPSILDSRNVVKCRVDRRVRGAFLLNRKNLALVERGEVSEIVYSLSGAGLREWLKDAVVEPHGGIRPESQGSRAFSFASERGTWYVEDDWVEPVNIQAHSYDPNLGPFNTAPAEWPDAPDSRWIWGVDNDQEDPAPEGTNFFRYEFTIDEAVGSKRYAVFAAGKDRFHLYVDGQLVIDADDAEAMSKTWRADFPLEPGEHVIAAKVKNLGGYAGFIAAFYRAGDAATETAAELLSVTGDDGWLVNPYPDPEPGWTPGEIMRVLLGEAEDRGVRFPQFLTPTFTDLLDSDGLPWEARDWSFDIGSEYYDVVERLEEVACDLWIDPETYELNMWVDRGVHRDTQSPAAQPVKFEVGRNVTKGASESTSEVKNTLLMKTAEGYIVQADGISDSVSKYGRVEGFVATEASPSISADLATRVFQMRAQPKTGATFDIIDVDDARPFVDFQVGDWVLAPSDEDDLVLEPRRVMSITVTEDRDTGQPVFALEFDTIFEDATQRQERWLKTTSDGTLGGTLANVSAGGSGGGLSSAQGTATGPAGTPGPPGPVGMGWEGEWSALTGYLARDVVSYDGSSWYAVLPSLGVQPGTDPLTWALVAQRGDPGDPGPQGAGLAFRGAWSSVTAYVANDLVEHDDLLWITAVSNTNSEPGVGALWSQIGIGGSGFARQVTNLASASGDGAITMSESFRIISMTASAACRIRLYRTSADRATDSARPYTNAPAVKGVVLAEFRWTAGGVTYWAEGQTASLAAGTDIVYYNVDEGVADIAINWIESS